MLTSKIVVFCAISLLGTILLDISIPRLLYINLDQTLTLQIRLFFYLLLGLTGFSSQFVLIKYLKRNTQEQTRPNQPLSYLTIYVAQFIFIFLFAIILFEIVIYGIYHTTILMAIAAFSFLSSSFILTLAAKTFLKWYILEKNKLLILYTSSLIVLSINIIVSGVMTVLYLQTKPDIIVERFGYVMPYYYPNIMNVLNIVNYLSSICGFAIAWIATILMLRQYSIRWRNNLHWIIVSIPVIYFIIQYNPVILVNILDILRLSIIPYSIIFTLFVTYGGLIGGVIFGAAFWTLTKLLKSKGVIFEFPTLAGYGFLFIFIANHIVFLSPANFPPFGVVTASLLPLASGLIFIGIYSSATTISLDLRLKDSIKKLVDKKSNLILSMSTSEAIVFLENQVSEIYDRTLQTDISIGSTPSLSFDEARDYMINELMEIRGSINSQTKFDSNKKNEGL